MLICPSYPCAPHSAVKWKRTTENEREEMKKKRNNGNCTQSFCCLSFELICAAKRL